ARRAHMSTTNTTTPVIDTPAPAPASPPPDPNAALALLVAQAVAQLDAIEAQLGGEPTISPATKRHAQRMRKGGANVVEEIATLATQHQLESPAMQVAPMQQNAARASALQPLAKRLAAFGKHVDDLVSEAQSEAWETALQF